MLPEGWSVTSLGEICNGQLQTGPFGSQLHADEYVDEGVAVVMPKDLISNKICIESAAKITLSRAKDLKKHRLVEGDLIFSRRGDVSRFALVDHHTAGAICGTGCLKAKPSKNHSPEFLSYFLQKKVVRLWLEQNAVGQTMPNMNTAILAELPLVTASSKQEERKIAKILSTWDKAITVTEKLLANSQQQKKALMQQLLTGKKRLNSSKFTEEWSVHSLIDVAEVIVSPVDKKSNDDELPVRLCNYTDVYYNTQITNKINFMCATAKQTEIDKFTLKVGDVIITKDSETPGDIAVPALVAEDLDGVLCGYHLAILRPNADLLDPAFLNYLLSTPKMRYYFFSLANGATRFGLSISGIKKASVRTPSIDEQKKIASILSITDQEIEQFEQQLAELKQEKRALMQQLLTGKRRVNLEEPA